MHDERRIYRGSDVAKGTRRPYKLITVTATHDAAYASLVCKC